MRAYKRITPVKLFTGGITRKKIVTLLAVAILVMAVPASTFAAPVIRVRKA